MMAERYFNIVEQTKYEMVITEPASIAELSDNFVSMTELEQQFGNSLSLYAPVVDRHLILGAAITRDLEKVAQELEATGRTTIVIEDAELLEVAREYRHHIPSGFAVRKNRLRHYVPKAARPQKTVRKSDITYTIYAAEMAVRHKYNLGSLHVPKYGHGLGYLRVLKKLVTLKEVLKAGPYYVSGREKWVRKVWAKPQEYFPS
jgi:hypothetical protein